jgi:hypothetical protein
MAKLPLRTFNTLKADYIRGGTFSAATMIVGAEGMIRSSNYVAGSAGWMIDGDGNAEFNNVTIRGTIYATAGEITGTLTIATGGKIVMPLVDDFEMWIQAGGIEIKDVVIDYIAAAIFMDTSGIHLVSSVQGQDHPGVEPGRHRPDPRPILVTHRRTLAVRVHCRGRGRGGARSCRAQRGGRSGELRPACRGSRAGCEGGETREGTSTEMSKLSYYPEATLRIPDPVVSGGRMNMDGSKKIVWHTTETPPSRFYRSNIYYHIQVRQDPTTGEVLWEQYIPFDLASRALRNDPNTPTQTNRDGDVCINVAIVGYAKDTPNLSDELLAEMAEFMVWAEKEWGVPAVFPWKFIGSEAYGIYGKARLSLSAWNHANGSLGHQHVPDGNTHWDPGVLPVWTCWPASCNLASCGTTNNLFGCPKAAYELFWPSPSLERSSVV